jgi:peptidyl-dipeptidase A
MNARNVLMLVLLAGILSAPGCKPKKQEPAEPPAPPKTEEEIMTDRLQAFLKEFVPKARKLDKDVSVAYWEAYTTGKDEAYKAAEETELEFRKYLSDEEKYKEIKEIYDAGVIKDPMLARQVVLIHNDYAENQISTELMEKMVALGTEVEKEFNIHRAKVGEEEYDRNRVKEVLRTSTNNKLREEVWISHKSIGGRIAPKVLELVKLRNQAAEELGYKSYWEMRMVLQEHDPDKVTAIFEDLAAQTEQPFKEAKTRMDEALAKRLKIKVEDLRPWHYADPFVQEAPSISEFDLDSLYEGKDILEVCKKYYKSFGLDPAPILEKSDVEPREGKSSHAFCFTIDREEPDVRILLNLKPTDQWMDTALHELGHGFYDVYYDDAMPWRLREPSHILTTEGVAQLFGEMTKNPNWIRQTLEVGEEDMPKVVEAADEARVLQQLVFARWSLVMFQFEKELYSNPDQNLNELWWGLVQKYQMVNPPEERNEPDWATKDHVVVAPVYYHNYVMGQMFKAQVLKAIAKHVGKDDPLEVIFSGNPEVGKFLVDRVFKPGSSLHFLELTKEVTGEEFSAKAYGESFSWGKRPETAQAEPEPADKT